MSTMDEIFTPWSGSAADLARDIGENPVTVRQWRNRGSIPPRYWLRIIEAAKARGHELTWLQMLGTSDQSEQAAS
jgi:hypothetical protein